MALGLALGEALNSLGLQVPLVFFFFFSAKIEHYLKYLVGITH